MTEEEEQKAVSTLDRLRVLHDLLAGYRELVYKLLIAHTTLLGAIAYFVSGPEFQKTDYFQRGSLIVALAVVAGIFTWWLLALWGRSDAHVTEADGLWRSLGVVPGAIEKHWYKRTWPPCVCLPLATVILVAVWLLVQPTT